MSDQDGPRYIVSVVYADGTTQDIRSHDPDVLTQAMRAARSAMQGRVVWVSEVGEEVLTPQPYRFIVEFGGAAPWVFDTLKEANAFIRGATATNYKIHPTIEVVKND